MTRIDYFDYFAFIILIIFLIYGSICTYDKTHDKIFTILFICGVLNLIYTYYALYCSEYIVHSNDINRIYNNP